MIFALVSLNWWWELLKCCYCCFDILCLILMMLFLNPYIILLLTFPSFLDFVDSDDEFLLKLLFVLFTSNSFLFMDLLILMVMNFWDIVCFWLFPLLWALLILWWTLFWECLLLLLWIWMFDYVMNLVLRVFVIVVVDLDVWWWIAENTYLLLSCFSLKASLCDFYCCWFVVCWSEFALWVGSLEWFIK